MKTNITIGYSTNRNSNYVNHFNNHIIDTIGCKCKIHHLVNNSVVSLSRAYNMILESSDPIDTICVFIHHDITFKSIGWGNKILNIFNNKKIDILGVAGTDRLYSHGVWCYDENNSFNQYDLWGKVWHTDGQKEWLTNFSNFKTINITQPVVVVDGLFIAFNPDTCEKFDESFNGFNFYDISFCLQNYLAGKTIAVTETIPICHESGGKITAEWETARLIFCEKYREKLPLKVK